MDLYWEDGDDVAAMAADNLVMVVRDALVNAGRYCVTAPPTDGELRGTQIVCGYPSGRGWADGAHPE